MVRENKQTEKPLLQLFSKRKKKKSIFHSWEEQCRGRELQLGVQSQEEILEQSFFNAGPQIQTPHKHKSPCIIFFTCWSDTMICRSQRRFSVTQQRCSQL